MEVRMKNFNSNTVKLRSIFNSGQKKKMCKKRTDKILEQLGKKKN